MWHLGNSFCLIAFLSTRKLLILKKERKGKKKGPALFAKVRFFWRTVVWRLGERGGWRSGGSSSVGGKQLPGRETGGRQLWSGNAKTERLERAPDSGFRCILGSAWWVPSLSKPDFWWFCLKTQRKQEWSRLARKWDMMMLLVGSLVLLSNLPFLASSSSSGSGSDFEEDFVHRLSALIGFVEYYRLKILHVLVKEKSLTKKIAVSSRSRRSCRRAHDCQPGKKVGWESLSMRWDSWADNDDGEIMVKWWWSDFEMIVKLYQYEVRQLMIYHSGEIGHVVYLRNLHNL